MPQATQNTSQNPANKAVLLPEAYGDPTYQEELAKIELRRRQLELLRMEREEEKFQAEATSQARAREASIRMIEKQEAELAYKQANCTHMKQWGREPSVFGQRDSSKQIRFFCCACFKTWLNFGSETNKEGLPPNLASMLDMEKIGG